MFLVSLVILSSKTKSQQQAFGFTMSPEAEILLLKTSDNNDHYFLWQVISRMPLSGYHLEYFINSRQKKNPFIIYFIWIKNRESCCRPVVLHPGCTVESLGEVFKSIDCHPHPRYSGLMVQGGAQILAIFLN